MRTEQLGASYLALPAGPGPHPGVVVIHELYGLNDNIRDICGRLAGQGYAALGVDLFAFDVMTAAAFDREQPGKQGGAGGGSRLLATNPCWCPR